MTSRSFIAELQLPGPRGPPSGARHGREKETHEFIFSWLSCTHDDGVAQHGRHTPKKETHSLGLPRTSLILAGHPYYNQLTRVKTRDPLTVSQDHIAGLSLQLIEVTSVCEVCRMTKSLFYDCQVNLFKTGQNWFEAKSRISNQPNYNFFV